jgi:hypothetical protein
MFYVFSSWSDKITFGSEILFELRYVLSDQAT